MKKKIYISGAIAHHGEAERRAAFAAAAAFCEDRGFESVKQVAGQ